MEESFRDGIAFAIPDFWQLSSLGTTEAQGNSSEIDAHSPFSMWIILLLESS